MAIIWDISEGGYFDYALRCDDCGDRIPEGAAYRHDGWRNRCMDCVDMEMDMDAEEGPSWRPERDADCFSFEDDGDVWDDEDD